MIVAEPPGRFMSLGEDGASVLKLIFVVLIAVVCLIALIAVLYLAIPPLRRFIRKDRPVWWVGDILIAAVVAILVLVGQNYLMSANSRGDEALSQDPRIQRLEDLRFVRDRSSEAYQPRPFRQFNLAGQNLANLQLKGANLVQADLTGANLAGTDLSYQAATKPTPEAPARAGQPTYLQGVNLCYAVLTGANMSYTFLINANLTGVDLTTTTLSGAVLNGADLSEATLPSDPASKESLLKNISYDENTVWPKDFQPPQSDTADRLKFLSVPVNQALYGTVARPTCHS